MPAYPPLHRTLRNFEEDLRNKRSHQTDDSSYKYAVTADRERYSARSIVGKQFNMVGIVLFLSYLAAALYYFYVRWTSTLDIGWVWWVAESWLLALLRAGHCGAGLPAWPQPAATLLCPLNCARALGACL